MTGKAIWYNKQWANLLEKSQDEIVPDDVHKLHRPEMRSKVSRAWNLSLQNGTPFEMEYQLRMPDQSFRWFLTRMNPVKDENGKIVRWIGTSTDIDQQKKCEEALTAARDEAERTKQLTSKFVAMVTHELRTPLSALLGFAELLKSSQIVGSEAAYYFDILCSSGEQLSQLINDLLDLSKIEANQLTFDYGRVNPLMILKDVVSQFSLKSTHEKRADHPARRHNRSKRNRNGSLKTQTNFI